MAIARIERRSGCIGVIISESGIKPPLDIALNTSCVASHTTRVAKDYK